VESFFHGIPFKSITSDVSYEQQTAFEGNGCNIGSHFVADAAGLIGVKRFMMKMPAQVFSEDASHFALPGDE
jgi:hypothetical protein